MIPKKYYHVTPIENLQSILQNGLEPRIGERSEELGEEVERIYLFHSKEDMEDALMNWLGEWFEDYLELVILELEIPDTPNSPCVITKLDSSGNKFYESYCYNAIAPEYITKVYDEDMQEITIQKPIQK